MLDSTAVSDSAVFPAFITPGIISIMVEKQQLAMRSHSQNSVSNKYFFSHVKYHVNQTKNQALTVETDNLNKNAVDYSQHTVVLAELAVLEIRFRQ